MTNELKRELKIATRMLQLSRILNDGAIRYLLLDKIDDLKGKLEKENVK